MDRFTIYNASFLFFFVVGLLTVEALHAQGTAFAYQGRLNNGRSPANGSYDLTFTLYATNSDGGVFIGPLTNTAVGVANGLFTVTLDFGSGAFDGNPRWLEIGVSTNGAGTFTTLSPRQQLTPTPYAIFANTTSQLMGNALQQVDNQALIVANSIVSTATNSLQATVSGQIQSATNSLVPTFNNNCFYRDDPNSEHVVPPIATQSSFAYSTNHPSLPLYKWDPAYSIWQ